MAYIYTSSGSLGWSLNQTLTGINGFGSAVTISGTVMAVWAPTGPTVYIFTSSLGQTWSQVQYLSYPVCCFSSGSTQYMSIAGPSIFVGGKNHGCY